jgi:hypothetical protein
MCIRRHLPDICAHVLSVCPAYKQFKKTVAVYGREIWYMNEKFKFMLNTWERKNLRIA